MQQINGKEISNSILSELSAEVTLLKKSGLAPKLALLIVGEDPASQIYLESAKKTALKIGIAAEERRLPLNLETILATIDGSRERFS